MSPSSSTTVAPMAMLQRRSLLEMLAIKRYFVEGIERFPVTTPATAAPAPRLPFMSMPGMEQAAKAQFQGLLGRPAREQVRPLLRFEQRRTFFNFRGRRDLDQLEEWANEHAKDPKAQAEYYRRLLEAESADFLIRRYESGQYAHNGECLSHYLAALYETNQLERAQRYIKPSDTLPLQEAPTGVMLNLGSKERPLYVLNSPPGGQGWRRLGLLVNVLLVGGIAYGFLSMNEQRLGGIGSRVHRLFNKQQPGITLHTFDDVQGCDEAKAELQEVVEFLRNPAKFNKLGAKMPKGVLLVGPPGTGKTLLAKAVAGEADVPFFYASGSAFDEVFVGVGSLRIRQMFEQAKEQAPCIIFIDELDAIGSKRNSRDPQHSRMSLNQLLTEMDGFAESTGVVVIGATNIPEALDKALLRPGRFDKHVTVPLPDVRGRLQIIERYLRETPIAHDVNIEVIARATPGFSGAEIFKMINQAKIAASVENGRVLTMEHLERSRDEMILGSERKSTVLTEDDRKLTAYHEGGHALVALYTAEAMPIHKATIIPRGRALGMVAQLPERDEVSITKSQLLARLDVAMGGRVAEELIFGPEKVTTGASSDFLAATNIARAMVTQFGMSERLGQRVIESGEDYDLLAPETKAVIDLEIKSFLEQSRARAAAILSSHRAELDRLALALLEHETLGAEEIKRIVFKKRSTEKLGSLDLFY